MVGWLFGSFVVLLLIGTPIAASLGLAAVITIVMSGMRVNMVVVGQTMFAGMTSYQLMAIPLLLAISFVCFVFINIIPSNPAEVALRVQQMPVITEEAIAEMEEMLGLNNILTGCSAACRGTLASVMSIPPARWPESWPAACPLHYSWQQPLLSSCWC